MLHVWVLIISSVFPTAILNPAQFTLFKDFSSVPDYQAIASLIDTTTQVVVNRSSLPYHCPWLPACICRDESSYTNGTYKLMVNCTKSGLRDIPENIPNVTTVLTLDGNYIQNITPGVFSHLINLKYLDLSNNKIQKLNKDAFQGLRNLRTLELSGNRIRYNNHSLPLSVFQPLEKLERLNLHQDINVIDMNEYYPTETLSHLKTLRQLLIDGIEPKNISNAFSNMPHLTTLDLSSEHGRCYLKTIVVDMFKNLNSVSDLKLNNCSLTFVEKGSFSELANLTSLDLSYNEKLHFKSLPNITYGLQRKHLREIKLVKIHETFGDCTRIERHHLVYFKNVSVKDLYLDFNRFAYVKEDAVEYIPRSLQKLYLTNNMLLAGEYIHKMFEKSVLKNLVILTLAEQNINFDAVKFFNNQTRYMLDTISEPDFTRIHKGNEEEDNGDEKHVKIANKTRADGVLQFCGNCQSQGVDYETVLYIPPGLKDLDLSGLQIRNELRNICFCEPNALVRMNLERNVFWSWRGPIAGLSNLLNLNLAWNSCDDLSEDVFDQLGGLIQLNITRNFIERFLRNDEEGRIFRNLKHLTSLIVVDNKLRRIPKNLFRGLTSLAVLDLSFNFLTQLDIEFSTHPLHFLDLHNNQLKTVGQSIIKKFEKDRKKNLPYRYLDLSNNNLYCECEEIHFVEWLTHTNVTLRGLSEYICTYYGKKMRLSAAKKIYMKLSKDCAHYTLVIIFSCFGIFLFLTIAFGGIIHRYRWDLRYLYYTIKLKMKGSKQFTRMNNEAEFKYDAFISYASENSVFVMNNLIPELEDNRQLKLLVHGRDFIAGEYVYDNIMQAIKTSRKTLILMSRDFLRSEWCIFEMNMARLESIKAGRNAVCVVMLEHVSISGLPLEIIDIIRQQTYLELPEESLDMNICWDRVHGTLVSDS